jgi:hypothetical protein
LCTSILPPLSELHPLCTFPSFMTPSPYTMTNWWLIFAGRTVFVFKNQITEHTSQSVGLVIDMVLYKALWLSNQSTQWGHVRESHDSSRPPKTDQWHAWTWRANTSYFKNYSCQLWPSLDDLRDWNMS